MASFKRLFFVAFALAVVIVAASATSLRLGRRELNDGVVCRGEVNYRAQYNKVISVNRICNSPRWNQTITQILALDRGYGGKGGHAEVIYGGLRQRNVTLHLWSQKSQPLNFTIEVYAKPYW